MLCKETGVHAMMPNQTSPDFVRDKKGSNGGEEVASLMMGEGVFLQFTIDVIVEPDEGGFHAFCPALKGLHVGGSTEKEAIQNAGDGAILYLKSLIRHGEPIPVGVTKEVVPTVRRTHEGMHAHTERLALSLT
jgi:predicted RNase H-like HicB family nuclease